MYSNMGVLRVAEMVLHLYHKYHSGLSADFGVGGALARVGGEIDFQ